MADHDPAILPFTAPRETVTPLRLTATHLE